MLLAEDATRGAFVTPYTQPQSPLTDSCVVCTRFVKGSMAL